jgi:hypothetical protein
MEQFLSSVSLSRILVLSRTVLSRTDGVSAAPTPALTPALTAHPSRSLHEPLFARRGSSLVTGAAW